MPRGKQRSKLTRVPPQKISRQCSALTASYDPCKNRATTITARRRLPVCWAHRHLGKVATYCQAVLGQGNRKCLKQIPWTDRQLCFSHKDFVLPCYLLRLPTEIRQQIFSYILDEYKSQYVQYYSYSTLVNKLCLSRQIFEEVTDVLYRNLVCDISIHERSLFILGRKCHSLRPGSWQKFKQFCFKFDASTNHGTILENVKSVVSHLRDYSIVKLDIRVQSLSIWHGDFRRVRNIYNDLPLYLDSFRQLGRVSEARATIIPDLPALNTCQALSRYMPDEAIIKATELKWREYYEEWVESLKRGRLEQNA
ncbi:hypothetical protein AJ78_03799 [Emergomyces pasteurianus Ep9510]|uniref:F-box domain-containing protein n=1 Tax=Emergomyces pasteurianus Ep9510 TaxID=1447872 RepID=A0A1J9QIL0_9EURO|nr:hypothetical protein AJ78_03799 [Emergomyces pasteurianus Ep9510]